MMEGIVYTFYRRMPVYYTVQGYLTRSKHLIQKNSFFFFFFLGGGGGCLALNFFLIPVKDAATLCTKVGRTLTQ